ncbi:hypothetical protein [Kocuria salsicia]|uniref:Uncharacterized protein n=1 Tax=Kocuria salsicia TaxID=664639 RepID=A0ABV3KE58_9MICC
MPGWSGTPRTGPALAHPELLPDAVRELRSAAREHSVAWLRVEPQVPSPVGTAFAAAVQRQNATTPAIAAGLHRLEARPAPRDIQPAYTRWVDLTREPEQTLAAMTRTSRNLWRRHGDKVIALASDSRPDAAEAVIELQHRTIGRKGFTAQSADYLRTAARRARDEAGSARTRAREASGRIRAGLTGGTQAGGK